MEEVVKQEKGGSNRMDTWHEGIGEGVGIMEGNVKMKRMEDDGRGIGTIRVKRGG